MWRHTTIILHPQKCIRPELIRPCRAYFVCVFILNCSLWTDKFDNSKMPVVSYWVCNVPQDKPDLQLLWPGGGRPVIEALIEGMKLLLAFGMGSMARSGTFGKLALLQTYLSFAALGPIVFFQIFQHLKIKTSVS